MTDFPSVSDRPEIGKTITHVLNPETGLWDRIRPLDLQKALAAAFEAGAGRSVARAEAERYAAEAIARFRLPHSEIFSP